MFLNNQTLPTLFSQLGLEDDELSIKRFIHQHQVQSGTLLYDASFWNDAQSQFLQEAICEDADWAEVIDQLDTMLRK